MTEKRLQKGCVTLTEELLDFGHRKRTPPFVVATPLPCPFGVEGWNLLKPFRFNFPPLAPRRYPTTTQIITSSKEAQHMAGKPVQLRQAVHPIVMSVTNQGLIPIAINPLQA